MVVVRRCLWPAVLEQSWEVEVRSCCWRPMTVKAVLSYVSVASGLQVSVQVVVVVPDCYLMLLMM